MTEQSGEPNTTPPSEPLSAREVEALLTLLSKGLRARQMYQPNNPVYQRFMTGLRAAFSRLWERASALHLTVDETGLVWEDQTFTVGEGRDSLAYHFLKDGVRYLTFRPGFEDELERFLGVVARARHLRAEEDDLVTLLWEQEFEFFQYGYVDGFGDGPELELPPPAGFDPVPRERLAAEVGAAGASGEAGEAGAQAAATPDPTAFTPDDFKETLHFLDANELDALHVELQNEWARDLKADVLSALFDRLEDPIPARQSEILGILRQLLPVFLGRGDVSTAALVLRELEATLASGDVLGAEQREEVEQLFEELSEPTVVGQLIQSLEVGGIQPDAEDLSRFLKRLRPAALPALVRAIETSTLGGVRDLLQAATDRLAEQHPSRVVEMLTSHDETLVLGAARLAGRVRLAEAARALVLLLHGPDPAARLAAVEALIGLRSSAAIDSLQRVLEDESREVRIAAAKGLASLRYQPSRARFERLLEGKALKAADITEKLAMFEAYAAVAGGAAVPLLERILLPRGVLRRRQPTDVRACAATALGRIQTPAAREVLEQVRSDADAVVRSAVLRALRQEVRAG